MSRGDYISKPLNTSEYTTNSTDFNSAEMWKHNLQSLFEVFQNTATDLNRSLKNEDVLELIELDHSILKFMIQNCSATLLAFIQSTRDTHTDISLVISGEEGNSIFTFTPKDN